MEFGRGAAVTHLEDMDFRAFAGRMGAHLRMFITLVSTGSVRRGQAPKG
jgi:hypothetical protein